jgi:hypothetical protein
LTLCCSLSQEKNMDIKYTKVIVFTNIQIEWQNNYE